MNKFVNLLLIFLSIQFIIPGVRSAYYKTEDQISQVSFTKASLEITALIIVIQLIYNLIMRFSSIKDMTFGNILKDSLFKGLIVLVGLYVVADLDSETLRNMTQGLESTGIETPKINTYFKSLFITMMMTFFVLIGCLFTP